MNEEAKENSYYKTFNKQMLALEAAATSKRFKIFSRERMGKEKTRYYDFLVCTVEKFWKDYCTKIDDNTQAVYNEMIRDGIPCRLYLDLEYMKAENLHITNGDRLTSAFIRYICIELEREYGLECDFHCNVIQLDSSTLEKFSRHVIFHLPDGKYFENNAAAGRFVKFCVSKLEDFTKTDVKELDDLGLKDFFVQKENSNQESFCDLAVYTKNRNFRIYLSNKCGKKNPFRLADDCTYYKRPIIKIDDHKRIFCDTLVECLDPIDPDNLLKFDYEIVKGKKTVDGLQTTIKEIKQRSQRYFYYDDDNSIEIGDDFCPHIDSQILKFVRQYKPDAVIVKRIYKANFKILYFNFNSYRFCFNVDRQHKSNQSYVEVKIGPKTFCQKCFDEDCKRNYIPKMYPLLVDDNVRMELCKFTEIKSDFLDLSLPDDIAWQVDVDLLDMFSNLNISNDDNFNK